MLEEIKTITWMKPAAGSEFQSFPKLDFSDLLNKYNRQGVISSDA